MDERACIRIAEDAFQRIGNLLPSLEVKKNVSDPVELSIDIPVQPGLKYAVNLNLQNRDELHFSVGNFWLEWFPCTDPSRVEAYIDAVSGFLSGRYRILEYYRGKKCTKAELQKPLKSGDWTTIGKTYHWGLSLSLQKSEKEIRNA
jgi:hypothetical protein